MPPNWVTIRTPEHGREYLVLLTMLPLRKLSALPEFLGHTRRIRGQLKHAPGLIGYSLYARPFQMRFWTLSVWESEAALQEFVAGGPHQETMVALRGKMGETRFVRWMLLGSQYPPRWQDAFLHHR